MEEEERDQDEEEEEEEITKCLEAGGNSLDEQHFLNYGALKIDMSRESLPKGTDSSPQRLFNQPSACLYVYMSLCLYPPSPQGATIKRDEETGEIYIARVIHGGLADRSGVCVCVLIVSITCV